MVVTTLMGIMIAIVIVVSLMPTLTGAIDALPEEDVLIGLSSLLNILPIVVVVVIILVAVAWIGGSAGNIPSVSDWWTERKEEKQRQKASVGEMERYSLSTRDVHWTKASFSSWREDSNLDIPDRTENLDLDIPDQIEDPKDNTWRQRGRVGK